MDVLTIYIQFRFSTRLDSTKALPDQQPGIALSHDLGVWVHERELGAYRMLSLFFSYALTGAVVEAAPLKPWPPAMVTCEAELSQSVLEVAVPLDNLGELTRLRDHFADEPPGEFITLDRAYPANAYLANVAGFAESLSLRQRMRAHAALERITEPDYRARQRLFEIRGRENIIRARARLESEIESFESVYAYTMSLQSFGRMSAQAFVFTAMVAPMLGPYLGIRITHADILTVGPQLLLLGSFVAVGVNIPFAKHDRQRYTGEYQARIERDIARVLVPKRPKSFVAVHSTLLHLPNTLPANASTERLDTLLNNTNWPHRAALKLYHALSGRGSGRPLNHVELDNVLYFGDDGEPVWVIAQRWKRYP